MAFCLIVLLLIYLFFVVVVVFWFWFVTFRYLENRDKHIGIVLLTIDTQNLYSQIRNNICDKIEIQTMIKWLWYLVESTWEKNLSK